MNGLRVQRALQRLTQVQLANAIGVSFQTICNWESGRTTPKAKMLEKLCNFFGCEKRELF